MLYKNMGVFDILTSSNKERAADIGCKVRRMRDKYSSIWIRDNNSGYEEVITKIRNIKDLTMLLKMYIDKGYTPVQHKVVKGNDEYYLVKE